MCGSPATAGQAIRPLEINYLRMKKQINTSLKFLVLMIILTGFIYPGLVTLVTTFIFSKEAQGSLIEKNGIIIGSEIIGQHLKDQKYFLPRPSVNDYNPLPSGGSNLGLLNPLLRQNAKVREQAFLKDNEIEKDLAVPSEMITASGSGLDPHISPEAALLQVKRVASERGLDQKEQEQIVKIIHDLTENRQYSIFGEPRINVFRLNLMIDSSYEYLRK